MVRGGVGVGWGGSGVRRVVVLDGNQTRCRLAESHIGSAVHATCSW